ncbi:hypothetical protein [Odoribacter splanchnicus]|uniref:hypothetical protein n=1 Tax=Odoribacter splanchnicus TaxID=28118 RepID=UPI0020CB4F71|nr:hypothetical protein [Odoribacter splanchnicus]
MASFTGSVTKGSSLEGHVKSKPFFGWCGATVPKALVLQTAKPVITICPLLSGLSTEILAWLRISLTELPEVAICSAILLSFPASQAKRPQ